MNPASETILSVENLSKKYFVDPRLGRKPGYREILRLMTGLSTDSGKLRANEFYALKEISFSLKRGEAVGVMGLNGAGKSTLLKVLLGRLPLDSGKYTVRGSIGGLVELNAGFHNEMTGIENVYNRARLLGKSDREVDDNLDDIIEFADIGDFIDSPVKTYSSGMTVRLGFAIAIHFVEDLVLCDEILAVGDFDFRQKCLKKINELRSIKSFVLVSHSNTDISNFCNRAILLHKGEMLIEGSPERVIECYALCDHHLTAGEVKEAIGKLTDTDGVKQPLKQKDALVSERRRKLFFDNPRLDGLFGWSIEPSALEGAYKNGVFSLGSAEKTLSIFQSIERIANIELLIDAECRNCEVKVYGLLEGELKLIEQSRYGKFLSYRFSGSGLKVVLVKPQLESKGFCKINEFKVALDQEDNDVTSAEVFTNSAKLSLFGPEFHDNEVVKDVGVRWSLRTRKSGFYYVAGDIFELRVDYTLTKNIENLRIGIPFFNTQGEMLLGPDTRNFPNNEMLGKKGDHEVTMYLNPLPINKGRLWLTLTICQDPAHLYRKHVEGFDIVNSRNEYGTMFTNPIWDVAGSGEHLKKIDHIDG